MSGILGLSHLVFTTCAERLADDSHLSALYHLGERNQYGAIPEKKDLLREPEGWRSTSMSLYHSRTASHPSFELIHAKGTNARPLGSYGLLLPPHPGLNGQAPPNSLAFLVDFLAVEQVIIDKTLPTYLAFSSKLEESACSMGAWLEVADLSVTVDLFKNLLMCEELFSDGETSLLRCRVLNKKFTKFLWVLRKIKSNAGVYFNDDIGLSTIGWIARGFDTSGETAQACGLKTSGRFDVAVGGRTLKAAFLYDNQSASHEILAV